MGAGDKNLLVVLGPTASGKTRLGVQLARELGGEIISADSRQVYRGLNIGAGKDLNEYGEGGPPVPFHLIDIVGLDQEFSVFDFQKRFVEVFEALVTRRTLPILVGGSGMYLESVLKGYRLVQAPEDSRLRAELAGLSFDELKARLRLVKERLHNTSDFGSRERVIRAIEIAAWSKTHPAEPLPVFQPLVLGTRWERRELRERIQERLSQRLQNGLVEEVEGLRASGVAWERLDSLGLEYRYIGDYLRGRISDRTELEEELGRAIFLFSKRQEAWFRRMERHGLTIHWIQRADFEKAKEEIQCLAK